MAAHRQSMPLPQPISSMVLLRKSMSRKSWRAKRGKSNPWFHNPIFWPIKRMRSAAVFWLIEASWYVVDIDSVLLQGPVGSDLNVVFLPAQRCQDSRRQVALE